MVSHPRCAMIAGRTGTRGFAATVVAQRLGFRGIERNAGICHPGGRGFAAKVVAQRPGFRGIERKTRGP